MSSTFVSVPMPAFNGPGASVAVDTLAATKTVVASGTFNAAIVTLEGSVDGGTTWAPLTTFQGTETRYVEAAVLLVRANVSGRRGAVPFSVDLGVGAVTVTAGTAISLPMPAANGGGAAVLASGLGEVKTCIAGGSFVGASLTVEASQDGGVSWAPVAQFAGKTGSITLGKVEAEYLRVNVSGRGEVVPFTATLDVAGVGASGGGGGGSAVQVFTYTATGAEGTSFTITLPTAMASSDYGVTGSLGKYTNFLQIAFPNYSGDRTVTDFVCETTLALTAGDTIDLFVAERS